jgi:hypothetical protein
MAARFAGWISLLSFAIQQGNLLVTKYNKIKMSSNFFRLFLFSFPFGNVCSDCQQ